MRRRRLGPLVPATSSHLLFNLFATPAIEGGNTTLLGSITADAGAGTRSLLINWGDGSIEHVDLASVATAFRVDHAYADDEPSGTPLDAIPIGVVLLVDSQAVDAAAASVQVANAAPQFEALTVTPLAVAGGLAGVHTSVSDIGPLDTLTLNVDWGDGYTEVTPTLRIHSAPIFGMCIIGGPLLSGRYGVRRRRRLVESDAVDRRHCANASEGPVGSNWRRIASAFDGRQRGRGV